MSCTRQEGEDRTLRRTHMFLSLVGVVHLIAPLTFHTHMRVAQDMIGTCCASAQFSKVIHSQHVSSTTLLDVPHPCPSFCSTPPPSAPNSLFMDGIRRPSCATPPGRLLFGQLAESTPLTGFEPETCIDVSSEHTPINYSSRRNSFNIKNNDLTTTVEALREISDGFPQQATARGSPQQAPTSVVNPWLSADMWSSTRKLVRSNASNASVASDFVEQEKKEIEIWHVCKL